MSKTIALVGHCGPDSAYLRMTLGSIERGAKIVSADDDESLKRALNDGVDLMLFNRVLDYGFDEHEGIALIRKLHLNYPKVRMMLVSNYPEAQAAAVHAGALPGFGKRDLGSARVKDMLRAAISGDAGTIESPAPAKTATT